MEMYVMVMIMIMNMIMKFMKFTINAVFCWLSYCFGNIITVDFFCTFFGSVCLAFAFARARFHYLFIRGWTYITPYINEIVYFFHSIRALDWCMCVCVRWMKHFFCDRNGLLVTKFHALTRLIRFFFLSPFLARHSFSKKKTTAKAGRRGKRCSTRDLLRYFGS